MLHITTEQIGAWLGAMYWPFIRISAMMLAAPVFSTASMPVRIRVIIAFAITLAVYPALPPVPAVDPISLPGLMIVLQQALIGVALGFILQLAFQLLVIAGEAIAMTMGLGFARMMDPQNGVQVPVVSQYFIIFATLVFVTLNGHLLLIELVMESFRELPIGVWGLSRESFWMLVSWGSQMFAGGVMVALPAVTALLVVNVAMGVISRAAPQLNIFAVGFPLMMLMGFILLALTAPVMVSQFTHYMLDAFRAAQELLRV